MLTALMNTIKGNRKAEVTQQRTRVRAGKESVTRHLPFQLLRPNVARPWHCQPRRQAAENMALARYLDQKATDYPPTVLRSDVLNFLHTSYAVLSQ